MRKLLMLVLLTLTIQAAEIGVNEHLGTMIPLDMTFINEKGEKVTLKKMMDGKPTMLSLNYYRCRGICNAQLSDMAKMLGELDLAENTDYKVITVSFGEGETPVMAKAKRKTMLEAIPRDFVQDAWHFYVSDGNSSAELAKDVGFAYKKEVSKAGVVDYIHPGTLVMISPKGKVTRYLNGINQLPFDVKMALMEAGEGKTGPTIAKKLLLCFAYDPKGRTYVFQWEKITGIVITLIMIFFFIYLVKTSGREEKDNQQTKGDE